LSRLLLCGAVGLGGCVRLGPDFQSPAQPWVEHWNTQALQQASQHNSQPDSRQWWHVFTDPVLDQLIAEADAHNADLEIAGLRVMEARAQLGIALSYRYPQVQQVSADSGYLKRRQWGGDNPQDNHLWQHSAGFDVGWELDFWGRFSRAIESADAAWFAAQSNYENALVLLHAQVAQTYYALRTAEARLLIAKNNAKLQKRSYEITERLFASGDNAELDLQQAKTQYLGTLSTIPDFEAQVASTGNALAILIGRPPGAMPELHSNTGVVPLVDRVVLQGVPADLLLRRPDVRTAEAQVAAQSALIGVAEADLYPSISLFGSIVWSANSLDGPSLRWDVFDHGRIRNNVRIQDARLQQLIVIYQDSVRQAAREADDAATGLLKALERERILSEASIAAERSVALANTQYREGYSDFQRVLDAQAALFAQQDNYLVNRNTAINSLIALYKAVGGGWYSDRPLLQPATRQQMQQRTDWGNLLDEGKEGVN
jgi:NodT family efflux transporter outer membrane factor (OMF) lipoprotein